MFSRISTNLPDNLPQRRIRLLVAQAPSPASTRNAQVLLTILLYAMPALIALHGAAVGDPDVWWHLRTGEWISQHHAVPRTDSFTTFGAGRPWAAYSWAFEVLLFSLFRCFGLYGIVLYTSGMVLAITVAVHRIVRRSLGDTPTAISISFVACFSMAHLYTPRPWLFTILLFALELDAVLLFQETRRLRSLFILPLIFAVWANVHIQFVDGLVVLGIACTEEAWAATRRRGASLRPACHFVVVTLICFGATLLNPYGFHIYRVAHDLAAQSGVMNSIQELQAMPFRDPADWAVLALTAASLMVLAQQTHPSLFKALLLLFAIVLAFRSQRDVWILAVVSAAILATRNQLEKRPLAPRLQLPHSVLVGAAFSIFLAGSLCLGVTNRRLQQRVIAAMPVRASSSIERGGYPGPIFNDYAWGGYLIWSLHQRVCIDGRASFQGDERIARSIATWGGAPSWSHDPDLLSANLVLGQRNAPLSQLLRQSNDFRLLYEDDLAVVFVRQHAIPIAP